MDSWLPLPAVCMWLWGWATVLIVATGRLLPASGPALWHNSIESTPEYDQRVGLECAVFLLEICDDLLPVTLYPTGEHDE
jgi:hypothetical protein